VTLTALDPTQASPPADAARNTSGPEAILSRSLFGPGAVGGLLIASLAVEVVAIGLLLATGVVKTNGGAFSVVLSAPVALIALMPAAILQLALALRRHRAWPAQDAYVWATLAAAKAAATPVERDMRAALAASLQAAAVGGDCLTPLAAVRTSPGKPPAGYSRRIIGTRYRGVVAAFLGGLWILVAIVIGMAVAGGVVWL